MKSLMNSISDENSSVLMSLVFEINIILKLTIIELITKEMGEIFTGDLQGLW